MGNSIMKKLWPLGLIAAGAVFGIAILVITKSLFVLLLGIVLLLAPIGFWSTAGIALLAAIIWIANKSDMM